LIKIDILGFQRSKCEWAVFFFQKKNSNFRKVAASVIRPNVLVKNPHNSFISGGMSRVSDMLSGASGGEVGVDLSMTKIEFPEAFSIYGAL
jgi:hypothetical protein